jgi:hypothetical protein
MMEQEADAGSGAAPRQARFERGGVERPMSN